jgi:hypothetical protein
LEVPYLSNSPLTAVMATVVPPRTITALWLTHPNSVTR